MSSIYIPTVCVSVSDFMRGDIIVPHESRECFVCLCALSSGGRACTTPDLEAIVNIYDTTQQQQHPKQKHPEQPTATPPRAFTLCCAGSRHVCMYVCVCFVRALTRHQNCCCWLAIASDAAAAVLLQLLLFC